MFFFIGVPPRELHIVEKAHLDAINDEFLKVLSPTLLREIPWA